MNDQGTPNVTIKRIMKEVIIIERNQEIVETIMIPKIDTTNGQEKITDRLQNINTIEIKITNHGIPGHVQDRLIVENMLMKAIVMKIVANDKNFFMFNSSCDLNLFDKILIYS